MEKVTPPKANPLSPDEDDVIERKEPAQPVPGESPEGDETPKKTENTETSQEPEDKKTKEAQEIGALSDLAGWWGGQKNFTADVKTDVYSIPQSYSLDIKYRSGLAALTGIPDETGMIKKYKAENFHKLHGKTYGALTRSDDQKLEMAMAAVAGFAFQNNPGNGNAVKLEVGGSRDWRHTVHKAAKILNEMNKDKGWNIQIQDAKKISFRRNDYGKLKKSNTADENKQQTTVQNKTPVKTKGLSTGPV